jgi:hypothetical protein
VLLLPLLQCCLIVGLQLAQLLLLLRCLLGAGLCNQHC